MARRKHSKIDKLPETIKDTVEQMMQADFTYQEIAEYIQSCGFEVSKSSVHRHAKNLITSLESVKMASENFRVITEELAKYPDVDTTEGIIRILSHQVYEAANNIGEEQWKEVDPVKLLNQANSLVRAASYKKGMDLKNKDILEAGFEQVKTLVFESMAKERPDLYAEVSKFLSDISGELI
jgi:Protein of unknown function (DUF3486).